MHRLGKFTLMSAKLNHSFVSGFHFSPTLQLPCILLCSPPASLRFPSQKWSSLMFTCCCSSEACRLSFWFCSSISSKSVVNQCISHLCWYLHINQVYLLLFKENEMLINGETFFVLQVKKKSVWKCNGSWLNLQIPFLFVLLPCCRASVYEDLSVKDVL